MSDCEHIIVDGWDFCPKCGLATRVDHREPIYWLDVNRVTPSQAARLFNGDYSTLIELPADSYGIVPASKPSKS